MLKNMLLYLYNFLALTKTLGGCQKFPFGETGKIYFLKKSGFINPNIFLWRVREVSMHQVSKQTYFGFTISRSGHYFNFRPKSVILILAYFVLVKKFSYICIKALRTGKAVWPINCKALKANCQLLKMRNNRPPNTKVRVWDAALTVS